MYYKYVQQQPEHTVRTLLGVFFFFFDPIGACFVYQSVALRVHVGVWVRCNKHRGSRRIVFFHATPRFPIFFVLFCFCAVRAIFSNFGNVRKDVSMKKDGIGVCVMCVVLVAVKECGHRSKHFGEIQC